MINNTKNPETDHTKSVKEMFSDKVKMRKSASYMSTNNTSVVESTTNYPQNYSILGARNTSPVGFYQKSKITKPQYLNR